MQELKILFDVPDHQVSVSAFVASARAAETAIATLNDELFDGIFDVQLVVAAPQQGSLRQVLKVIVKLGKIGVVVSGTTWAGFWSVVQVLETEIAMGVVEELTGDTPAEIARRIARDYKTKREEAANEKAAKELEQEAIEQLCREVEGILTGTTSGALAASRDVLNRLPMSDEATFKLSDAQSDMFEQCIEDKTISGVTFENSKYEPIPRNQFPERAIRPAKLKDKDEDEKSWRVRNEEIVVTSPNLDEDDQPRKWKGRTGSNKAILFNVEDREFWRKVHSLEVTFAEDDRMGVQLATRLVNGRPRGNTVLRVISFNGVSMGKPLDDNALTATLGRIETDSEEGDYGGSLFS
ncbi:hypothetical protein J7413_02865 [Shimia sp. R10_1]|uniref:hypothetical protein n=1 Tax=Shimia sp. R10_1 TaxID=2821095 RepID=UPI001ADC989B|nr:hypothetical protein [Shimia sp. R10_1]MBO9472469.1 hypothetical protein [Shimia sp. R10_1]